MALVSSAAASAQLPEDFAIRTLGIKSDRNLGAKHVGCAFGDTPIIMRKFVQTYPRHAYTVPDVAEYCIAVLREAAKRKRQGYVYSRMQPGKAVQEWSLIVRAAWAAQNRYFNAEGQAKILNCELAFDAGYVYGLRHPDKPMRLEQNESRAEETARLCFRNARAVSSKDAFVAGAELAQRDYKAGG